MSGGRLERYLLSVWYGPARGDWLRPLGYIYACAMRLRAWLYAHGIKRRVVSTVPVLVVGNLTAGGTGKTPLVIWLVEQLAARGARPGIVSRGYGGRGGAEAQLVGDSSTVHDVGDEPIMMARRTGVPVAVCRDRPNAVRRAVEAGANIVVADDGLQHLALERDAQIVVVDGERRFGNGRCLPAGPLREPMGRLSDVDAIVVNGGGAGDAMTMTVQPDDAVRLHDGERRPLAAFASTGAHAVAAIGNPERFFATLRDHAIGIDTWTLPDHGQLRASDICFDDERPVLITEKDAVKCQGLTTTNVWYVPVSAQPDAPARDALLAIIERLMSTIKA